MKRLLVTGVPGWLTEALLHDLARDRGPALEEVRSLVMPGSRPPDIQSTNVRFTAVEGRLEDEASLAAATKGCDAVLHAAGVLHVRRTSDWYDVNTHGTKRLLNAALTSGVKRFVLVSTNAAGGKAPHASHLMTEADPSRPLSHYGRSKLLAEEHVLNAKLEGVVIRPCMFYGPPVPARHVEIYRRILTGRMPIVGSGDYARSLTHIDNLVQGCRLALSHPSAPGEAFYIADDPVYTTRRVTEAMAQALGVTPRYLRLPALSASLAFLLDRLLASLGLYWQNLHLVGEANWHVGVSIAKAKAVLGYAPTETLESGMQGAIDWCRARHLL